VLRETLVKGVDDPLRTLDGREGGGEEGVGLILHSFTHCGLDLGRQEDGGSEDGESRGNADICGSAMYDADDATVKT